MQVQITILCSKRDVYFLEETESPVSEVIDLFPQLCPSLGAVAGATASDAQVPAGTVWFFESILGLRFLTMMEERLLGSCLQGGILCLKSSTLEFPRSLCGNPGWLN